MIEKGTGGSKTLTGLDFEKRTDIRDIFKKIEGYSVEGNELRYNNDVVAKFFKKFSVYNKLLKSYGVDWKSRISKKLLPDETLFVLSSNTLFIIEMKFQKVAGSVDEKLQTCDFKKKQYEKLFKDTKITIRYCYILSEWFKHKSYKDTLDYIKSVNCDYFFEKLPLTYLGLPQSITN